MRTGVCLGFFPPESFFIVIILLRSRFINPTGLSLLCVFVGRGEAVFDSS